MISLKRQASESAQCLACYDPIHQFKRVKAKGSLLLENKNIFEGKNYTAFLVLLGTKSEQKQKQFEFLSLTYQKKISFYYILQWCPPKLLEPTEKFVNTFYEHVIQNTPVFHSYDKIPSLHSSNRKYQSTDVIQKMNLIQMST